MHSFYQNLQVRLTYSLQPPQSLAVLDSLSENMEKKSKDLVVNFNLLNNVSLLFGVNMMCNSNAKFKILRKYFFVLCNICLIVGANTINLSDSSHPSLCIQKPVPIAIIKLKQILAFITFVSIYFQVLFHRSTISSTVNLLRKSDLIFSNLNVRFAYKKFNLVIKLSVLATFFINLGVFAVLCVNYGIESFEEIILQFVLNIYPIILIYLMLLLDVYICWLVRIKLSALRLLLSELCEFKDTIGDKSNWKVNLIQENPKIFFTDLIKISEIYEILYEIVGELNSAFGLFCLSSIGKEMALVVTNENGKIINIFAALESISLTCHVFLLFKAATGLTNEGTKMEILGFLYLYLFIQLL